ncbi:unnamed protein product [Rotaria sp. Silwood2]|nr:unnamed protein product [Rotaria sp. Silwood2]
MEEQEPATTSHEGAPNNYPAESITMSDASKFQNQQNNVYQQTLNNETVEKEKTKQNPIIHQPNEPRDLYYFNKTESTEKEQQQSSCEKCKTSNEKNSKSSDTWSDCCDLTEGCCVAVSIFGEFDDCVCCCD